MAAKARAGGASRALARATARPLSWWVALLVLAFVVPAAGARSCASSCVWEGKKVTLAGGAAPDGSRYQWVGYSRRQVDYAGGARAMRLYCVDLRVGDASRTGASCWGPGKRLYENAAFAGGPRAFPYQRGVARPDVVIDGITDARVAKLRVVYTDLAGGRHELAVNYVRVARQRLAAGRSKRARKAIRGIAGFGLFAAFVPADWVTRDKLFERERELRGSDPSLPPGGGPVDLGDLMYRSVFSACPGRPDGPFELTAYDTAGNELRTMPEAACRPVGASAGLLPGHAVRDCALDGDLDRDYPASVLRRALDEVPSDVIEYSDCDDVLRAALLDAPGRGGGGSGAANAAGPAGARAAPVDPGGSPAGDGGVAPGGARSEEGESGGDGQALLGSVARATGLPWTWLLTGVLAALALALYLLHERIGASLRGLAARLAPGASD